MNIEQDEANKRFDEALENQRQAALFSLTDQIMAANLRLQAAQDELSGLIEQYRLLIGTRLPDPS